MYIRKLISLSLSALLITSLLCIFSVSATGGKTYYLFGYINGANYACEDDYQNMGEYRFENGQVTVCFSKDSYVAVKEEGNANWYMTNGWQGNDTTSVTLYNTNELGEYADKMFIPKDTEISLVLCDNGDGTLTLSYIKPQETTSESSTSSTSSSTQGVKIRDELNMLVASYSFGVDESIYTPDSYSSYKEAYENANRLLMDNNSTDEQLEKAYTDLIDAKNNLVRLADTISTETIATESEETVTSEKPESSIATDVTKSSEETSESVQSTSFVTEPTENTTTPTCTISAREKLSMLVAEYSFGIDESIYTSDSYSLYKEAYENANRLLVDNDSTDEQIEKAYTDLIDAKNSLVRLADTISTETIATESEETSESVQSTSFVTEPTEETTTPTCTISAREKLSMLVAEYSFGVDESIYTLDSYSVYKEAYEKANRLLVDNNSTDEQLEKAYTDLIDAKNSLVRLADTTSMATSETTEPSSGETITDPSETIEPTSSNPSITTDPINATGTEPTTQENKENASTVSLGVSSKNLKAGKTFHLKVNNTEGKPTFTSSKNRIVKVDSYGNITALKKGTSIVSVNVDGKTLKCRITVTSNPVAKISGKKVNPTRKYNIKKGSFITVRLDGKAVALKNTYTTSNKSIAKVVSKRNTKIVKIKALKKGDAKILIKVNGYKTIKIKVNVK